MVAYGVLLITLLLFGLTAAFVTLPRWFARSLHRHRLWRLRDAIVDQIIDGSLPGDHPAVKEIQQRVEDTICVCGKLILLHLWLFHRASKRVGVRPAPRFPSLTGLSPEQAELVTQYRQSWDILCTGMVLLGTWVGVGVVMWRLPQALRDAHSTRTSGDRPRPAIGVATDSAALSPLGRRAREIFEDERVFASA